jgi:hypothetical protein
MELQNQTIDSLQSIFSTIFENTNNMILNNREYCRKLPEIYSRMSIIYTENIIAINKIFNDIAFANAGAFKNTFSFS